ncbi:hypothetical protein [Vibrio phage V-YDF132]|nr:hypothetical protein [Vibrio phage V-YDF132]
MSDLPIVLASFQEIESIATGGGAKRFIWSDEIVSFNSKEQKVQFNEQAREIGTEPLIIDSFTANAMVKVFEAVKPETKEHLIKRVARNRAYFADTVNKVWKCIK